MIKGKFDFKELKQYQKKLEKLAKDSEKIDEFCEQCAKRLAAELLKIVIPLTPAEQSLKYIDEDGKPKTKKVGGTLKRGWIAKTEQEAENGTETENLGAYIQSAIDSLNITKSGNIYTIEIINPVHYASYVEEGHRQEVGRYVPAIGKKLKQSFVEGKHMLRDSEKELDKKTKAILERKIKTFLEEYLNGN